jgi:hypothetical protein
MSGELISFNLPRGMAAIGRADEVSLDEYERVGI